MNSAKAKGQEQLEIIRKRRAGPKSTTDSKPEEQNESGPFSESESETSEPNDENDEYDAGDENPDSYVTGEEDMDFVQEDDEGPIGVELPFEFSRHAYKKPKEYLGDAIEWMVHNKLNPAFSRTDTRYQMAFIKLDDEVKGRTGSQFISAVWDPAFQRALMARPHMATVPCPAIEEQKCEACNKSNHQATFAMTFYGSPYSLETLEPLYDEEEEGDEELDRDGNVIPNEETSFRLGR